MNKREFSQRQRICQSSDNYVTTSQHEPVCNTVGAELIPILHLKNMLDDGEQRTGSYAYTDSTRLKTPSMSQTTLLILGQKKGVAKKRLD